MRTFAHSVPAWLHALSGFLALALIAVLRLLLKQLLLSTLATAISIVTVGALLLAFELALFLHTTVVLRH